jgi:hypothetical protein
VLLELGGRYTLREVGDGTLVSCRCRSGGRGRMMRTGRMKRIGAGEGSWLGQPDLGLDGQRATKTNLQRLTLILSASQRSRPIQRRMTRSQRDLLPRLDHLRRRRRRLQRLLVDPLPARSLTLLVFLGQQRLLDRAELFWGWSEAERRRRGRGEVRFGG